MSIDLSNKLKTAMRNQNITQNDLAKVLEMTKQSFSNKMQRDTFTAEEVVKIANYLGMTALLKGENEYIIQ